MLISESSRLLTHYFTQPARMVLAQQLQTPYASRSNLLGLNWHNTDSFRPEFVKFLTESPSTEGFDVRELPLINALHFGGRLFQQNLVDTYIRVERDHIQWIKYNQKKILAEQYTGVTSFINQLAEKKMPQLVKRLFYPPLFLVRRGIIWKNFKMQWLLFDDSDHLISLSP